MIISDIEVKDQCNSCESTQANVCGASCYDIFSISRWLDIEVEEEEEKRKKKLKMRLLSATTATLSLFLLQLEYQSFKSFQAFFLLFLLFIQSIWSSLYVTRIQATILGFANVSLGALTAESFKTAP